MKKVAIIANYTENLEISENLKLSRKKLTEVFRESGIELRRVRMSSFDSKKGVFLDYVDFNEKWEFEIFREEYKPDVLWNRTSPGCMYTYNLLEKSGYDIFPNLNLVQLSSDKYEMSLFFEKYQPKTVLLESFFEDQKIQDIFWEKVVLKPIRSNSWKGIEFPKKSELLVNEARFEGLKQLYIVQEMKDFSGGIPGITDGIHDLRMVYIGWKYSHSTLRVPQKWSLKSNVWAGGTEYAIKKEDIPKDVWVILEDVLKENVDIFSEDSIFSLDFWYSFDEEKYYIIEVNCSPWVSFWVNVKDLFLQVFFPDLARFFCEKLWIDI